MACRDEHDEFGTIIGGVGAVLNALLHGHAQSLADVVVVAAGGALGGRLGSALPDIIEPATSPHHRSTGHSLAVGGLVAGKGVPAVATWKRDLMRTSPPNDQAARMLRLFAGAMAVGAPVGYVSHLALDATTPKGLPLLTRGC